MDKRIKKTRKNIVNVFLQLLEEKSINEISAQEIVNLAEISRSTFYQHYTDVYNLLDQAEDELFSEISHLLEGYPCEVIKTDPLRLFCELFYYFKRNSKICIVLINKNGSITTGQRIRKMIQDKFNNEWEALLNCQNKSTAHYLTQYIISGFVGLLQEWIAEGMQEPEEDMARIAREFISRSIAGNKPITQKEADTAMTDFKEKIREDAKSFSAGILHNTSALIDEKSTEIQKRVEEGLSAASCRLAQKGSSLQTGQPPSPEQREQQKQKLLKKKAELDEKYQEKRAKLTREGKGDKLEKERLDYEKEAAKIQKKLDTLKGAE